jgi:phosphate transport system protein
MKSVFQKEMDKLKSRLLLMSAYVEENLQNAVRAFLDNNVTLAEKIAESDITVNSMEVEIEEECLKILALHQPVAIDLRFLAAVLRINNELERVADQAVNICEEVTPVRDPDLHVEHARISQMASKARHMLTKCLDAFVNNDEQLAYTICTMDDEVDDLNDEIAELVIAAIQRQPAQTRSQLHVLRVARNLERVADLATNIAEMVIYINIGKIVRHNLNN